MSLDILNDLQPSGDFQALSDILAELDMKKGGTSHHEGSPRKSRMEEKEEKGGKVGGGRAMEEIEVDMSVFKAKIVVCKLCDRKYY
jgi:hypothetical protein